MLSCVDVLKALIKYQFRFFTSNSRSFSKVNILEAGTPLLKKEEEKLEGEQFEGLEYSILGWRTERASK
jgi:hypothetical protein